MSFRRDSDPLLDAPLPDAREMCFAQGKAFVYMRDGDDQHVWAELPDGTINCHHIEKGTVHRKLPTEFFEPT